MMQAAPPLCLPAVEFLRETPPHPPTPLHLQSILSSRSAPSSSACQCSTGRPQTPPPGGLKPLRSARSSRQFQASPTGGRWTIHAPQNAPAPPMLKIPSASAPSLHRLHSPDRACGDHACCLAPRRRKSPPHHPPAASTARLQPRDQCARGLSLLRHALRPALRRRHPPTIHSPAATAPLHHLRAVRGPLPNTPDSPKSPARVPSPRTAEILAHSRGSHLAPAPIPAGQPSRKVVRPVPSTHQKRARQSSSSLPAETRLAPSPAPPV